MLYEHVHSHFWFRIANLQHRCFFFAIDSCGCVIALLSFLNRRFSQISFLFIHFVSLIRMWVPTSILRYLDYVWSLRWWRCIKHRLNWLTGSVWIWWWWRYIRSQWAGRRLNFTLVLLYNETWQMAGFHLNFAMVALYETRLSVATFEFCDILTTFEVCAPACKQVAKGL